MSYILGLFDISWWSETALVLARYNGEVVITAVSGNDLIPKPEVFKKHPSISAASSEKFFVIEHDEQLVEVRSGQQVEVQGSWLSLDTVISLASLGYLSVENDSWVPRR
jgi:hypothetical protein